ncbi:MAG: VOC family protein [Anaerolineae bacterium]|jgi:catechol 2,3-dioxygenase
MNDFRLPEGTQVGHVRLQISDLQRALGFYQELLGFRQVLRDGPVVVLSATGQAPHHLVLVEHRGARRKPANTTGLYHVAIRLPSRQALSRVFQRLLTHEWPFQGFADHLVSEALYLSDPDGNGLELYVDRPRDQWGRRNGQIEMATDPLDVQSLLAEAEPRIELWAGIDPATDVGHVHLHVSDLAQAERFYHGLLGLDVTQRGYPGALFLSAGGYHHHLGVNTWAGVRASSPPPDAVGLLSFSLRLPDQEARRALEQRARESSIGLEDPGDSSCAGGVLLRDPDGNGVELVVAKSEVYN